MVLTVGIDVIIGIVAANAILRKKDLTALVQGKTAQIICTVLGVAIIFVGGVMTYFDTQKTLLSAKMMFIFVSIGTKRNM